MGGQIVSKDRDLTILTSKHGGLYNFHKHWGWTNLIWRIRWWIKPKGGQRLQQLPGLVNVCKTRWKDPPFFMGKSTILTGPFSSSQTVKVYQAGYCGDGDLELKKGWWVFLEDILHRIQGWFHPSSSSLSCRIHWIIVWWLNIEDVEKMMFPEKMNKLVGALEHEFYDFPYIGNVIIPSDELHHFSEGLVNHQPVIYIGINRYYNHYYDTIPLLMIIPL